jgi:hypothetical protein
VTLNLIKLAVGCEGLAHLRDFQANRFAGNEVPGRVGEIWHRTRIAPRRREELLDGGSLYWVIRRAVQARQRILELRPVACDDGIERCEFILDPKIVQTRPQPRRPFQGWRYLDVADAPPDLAALAKGLEDIPAQMRSDLIELALI